jgi:hypothetical protein
LTARSSPSPRKRGPSVETEVNAAWDVAASDATINAYGVAGAASAAFSECAGGQVRALSRCLAVLAKWPLLASPDGPAVWLAECEESARGTLRDLS